MKKLFLLVLLFTIPIFSQSIRYYPVQIDSASSVSDSLDLGGILGDPNQKIIGFASASSWTTADLTFLSWKPLAWYSVYEKDGTELTYTFSDSVFVVAKPIDFAGIRYLKIRSGTSSSPVNQADDRTIYIIIREY